MLDTTLESSICLGYYATPPECLPLSLSRGDQAGSISIMLSILIWRLSTAPAAGDGRRGGGGLRATGHGRPHDITSLTASRACLFRSMIKLLSSSWRGGRILQKQKEQTRDTGPTDLRSPCHG